MSDFNISNEDAPVNGGQGDEANNGFNFEESYNQLRPEYTRATQKLSVVEQRLSEYESFMEAISDPETQREALASLGFEMETGAEPAADEFTDPLEAEVERLRSVVDELQQGRELEAATREERANLELRDDFIGSALSYIEEQTHTKFDAKDEEVLGNLAIAMTGDDGVPDVQGAYNVLYGEEGLLERQRAQWIDSKVGAYSAPWGTTIPADKRPTNRSERIEFVDQRLMAQDRLQQ